MKFDAIHPVVATVSGLTAPVPGIWAYVEHLNSAIVLATSVLGFVVACLSAAWWVRRWVYSLKKKTRKRRKQHAV